MSDNYTWNYHNPVRVVCGSLENLAQYIPTRNVLLVTTQGFVRRGVVQRVKDILSNHHVTVWGEVKPNPTLQDLEVATELLGSLATGCVIGLGGGSAIDAAKVLATTLKDSTNQKLRQVLNGEVVSSWTARLPLIVIPTTSGTGSEVTPFATIWDNSEHGKYSLVGDFVYPDLALLDLNLTLTLGYEDSLYPALDTISHALESLWNRNSTPVTRAFAITALALSNRGLPLVINEPENLEGRRILQNASLLAGQAISQTFTAIAHSISYSLTSYFGVPHGLASSFILPQLIDLNLSKISNDNFEREIILSSRALLDELNLKNKVSSYLPPKFEILKLENEFNYDRAKNYINDIGDVKKNIKKFFQLIALSYREYCAIQLNNPLY